MLGQKDTFAPQIAGVSAHPWRPCHPRGSNAFESESTRTASSQKGHRR